MKASVIIPAYNCLPLLMITIQSLEKQDLPYSEFEVIVVDDCSSDGAKDFLLSYKGNMNLIPLINEENLGRAKSRNRGIEHVGGEKIIFIDADMEFRPDFLSKHLSLHKDKPIATVGSVVFHPGLEKNGLMRYFEKRGAAKLEPGQPIPGRYFLSGNSCVPASVVREIGGFDEGFQAYGGEDLEFGLRVAEKVQLYYVPEAVTYHHHSRKMEESLETFRKYGEFCLPYLLKKHPELFKDLKLDNIPSKSPGDVFKAISCTAPVYSLIKLLTKLDKVPDFFYSYLIFRNYREGYLKSRKKNVK